MSGLMLVVADDPLQRTLGHVIKFSERPVPCAMPVDKPHYTVSDRLCLRLVEQPVVFQSCFSWSGWGIRKLISAELSQAFDLPSYLPWDEQFPSTLVPIQAFRVVGDAALECLRPPTDASRPRIEALEGAATDYTQRDPAIWLPTMGKWLPGSWTEATIASKAVKADNADVDFRPWNLRISLVFPTADSRVLRCFELLALRRWRHLVSRSFFGYLRKQYGVRWAKRLMEARRKRSPGTGSRKRPCDVHDSEVEGHSM